MHRCLRISHCDWDAPRAPCVDGSAQKCVASRDTALSIEPPVLPSTASTRSRELDANAADTSAWARGSSGYGAPSGTSIAVLVSLPPYGVLTLLLWGVA